MQPRPSFDRALLIPIAVGVVSILGIGWIFLTSDLGKSLIPPTAIPSSFSSPEAATLTPSPLATPSQDETPTATGIRPEADSGPPAEKLPSTSTLITESLLTPSPRATSSQDETPTATSTRTPPPALTPTSTRTLRPTARFTPASNQPQSLPAGKYDDTDPNIAYDRFWTALKNPGTENAYKGTIHASAGIGNEASFRFTGEGFRLGYQRGKNFGTVTVIIDGQPYSFHEQAFDLVWRSPQLSPGDHFVRIIHDSGESINLDYIEILD